MEKEADLAVQSSGRNDGEVHPGVDLRKGSLKQEYVLKGNRMYDQVCEELDVPFRRCGQYVGFKMCIRDRYYGCIGNPECDFMVWQKPSKEKCPQCGSLMLEKGNKLVCYNEDCGYIMEKKSED